MKYKTVYVIVTFRAEVPEDMDLNKIDQEAVSHFENESFRLSIEDYPDAKNSDPLFDFDEVATGTSVSMQIGIE